MKQMNRFCFGLVLLMLAGQFGVQAAAKKTSKTSKNSESSSHSGVIAKNPYLGAIVVDAATGKVLFEDHADAKGYPASVQKLMDLVVILERIEHGKLSLQD